MKKALIFDPYLNTLGGGERYTLSFASCLANQGYSVDIAWNHVGTLMEAESRFGISFESLHISESAYKICTEKTSLKNKYNYFKNYDLIFWVSDGSLPFLFSKNNLVHFQVPFTVLGGNPITNFVKSFFINKFVYNSEFTQKVIEKSLAKNKGVVLYPPIDVDKLVVSQKEKLILSVARFGSPSHSKRQDVLIEAFRQLSEQVDGYKLVLAGGVVGDSILVDSLREQAGNLNVEIITSPDFNVLKNLYSKAQFFWHAAGFDIDEEKEPEKVEHFGMTTVEAMASGAIPLVIAKGGQKEILASFPELLCSTSTQIANKTADLARDHAAQAVLTEKLIATSKQFSQSVFNDKITSLLK